MILLLPCDLRYEKREIIGEYDRANFEQDNQTK